MKLRAREAFSITIVALLPSVGCGDEAPFTAPAAVTPDEGEPGSTGSAGTSGSGSGRRDAGTGAGAGTGGSGRRDSGAAQGGTSSTVGMGGAAARDAGRSMVDAATRDGSHRDAATPVGVVINEIVADPQRDWNDSGDGGTPFDSAPGDGSVTGADEWVELYNGSGAVLDLTGWTLVMTDGTPATETFGSDDALLWFSASGVLTAFQPREYLVVGNPKGDLNNAVTLELHDARGFLMDRVVLGGDGGAPSGNATSTDDEAIARVPNASDTGDDARDFSARPPTPGTAN